MSVRKAPNIDSLISRGAPVKSDMTEYTSISLRLPYSLLIEIDSCVKKCVGIKRTGWILQALQKEIEIQKMK
jgi:hypothetical protein